jgi:hypothetical protein
VLLVRVILDGAKRRVLHSSPPRAAMPRTRYDFAFPFRGWWQGLPFPRARARICMRYTCRESLRTAHAQPNLGAPPPTPRPPAFACGRLSASSLGPRSFVGLSPLSGCRIELGGWAWSWVVPPPHTGPF